MCCAFTDAFSDSTLRLPKDVYPPGEHQLYVPRDKFKAKLNVKDAALFSGSLRDNLDPFGNAQPVLPP